MKFFILFSCALAAASAGYLTPYAGHGIHLPVINHNGVPVDTAEVQHARAAHFAAHAEASARSGYGYGGHYAVAGPVLAHAAGPVVLAHHATPHAYPTSHVLPAVTHDGVPLNTPEVAAATADHFAAHHEALGRVSHHYRKRRGVYAYGAQHLPIIDHSGVPVDTAEVQHAKAAHYAAHAEANARSGYGGYHGVAAVAYGASPYAYSAPHAYGAHYYGVPAIAHDGTPLDTPEVQHAKVAHFAAYHEAAARNSVHPGAYGVYGGHYNGAPVETPEVQHAKAAHFAAHAAARSGHHY